MKGFAHAGDREYEVSSAADRGRIVIQVGGRPVEVVLEDRREPVRRAYVGRRLVTFGWSRAEGAWRILIDGLEYDVVLRDPKSETLAKASATGGVAAQVEIRAPIPGLVKRILLQEGEAVRRDQAVLHLDAMKLENEIASPRDGVIRSIAVREGQPVEKGALLFVVA